MGIINILAIYQHKHWLIVIKSTTYRVKHVMEKYLNSERKEFDRRKLINKRKEEKNLGEN